ncbi:importin-13 isoform X2 [Ischnura elegans]|uniref:importin-13 isoform X2 n=1 Tax=Ischnura elegans TaxID=197161 RepID=UPI001ED8B4D7|nr:importin-13 isoform X2 [Ischnura elegans]
MEITAGNLEQIILQFYCSDVVNQTPAHEWLTIAQQSPNAWCFVWDLLSPEKSPEVQFFAATTLHTKVAKHLREIPEEQYESFKNKLIDTLKIYRNGPKIIVNRLCIAMAAFILQISPEKWEHPLSTLMNTFCPSSSPSDCDESLRCLLLQLFMVLPEEFQTMHIPQGRRGLVRNELQKSYPQAVSSVLVWALEWGSQHEVEVAAECARAWMQLGVPLPEVIGEGGIAPKLIRLVCQIPWGAVTSASLEALGEMATHPDTHHHPRSVLSLASSLVPAVGELARRWTMAGIQEAACSSFTLITSIGESHVRLLLGEAKEGVANPSEVLLLILELLLECTGMQGQYPSEETLSAIPFGFWYILQEEVVSLETAQHDAYIRLLSPVYSRLADILLLKSVLPDGREDLPPFTQEEAESFRCYRTDIGDTMTYCHGMLHESLSKQLLSRLNEQLEVHRRNPCVWQPLEACLHALLSIAECARGESEADSNISQCMSAVGSLSLSSNPRLLATALEVIGAHAEWLNDHPGAVGIVLPLLVQGLSNVQTAPSATMALKDLSRDCSAGLMPYAHLILNASQEVISQGTLRPAETIRLMYVVGRVMSCLSVSDTAPFLDNLLMPFLNHLRQLNGGVPSPAVKASIVVRLRMIAALFSAMYIQSDNAGTSPWAPILLPHLQQIFPILEEISAKWYYDEAVMQAVFLVPKNAATTLLDDIIPALPAVMHLLITSYVLHQHPVMLDLARHLIVMFGSNKVSGAPVIGNLLEDICRTTLCLPGNPNPISSDRVDILEAFFSLLSQVARRNPSSLASLGSPVDVSTLLRASTEALSLPEAPVIKSTSSFLSNFIMHGSEVKEIQSAIQNYGEALVQRLLLCIGRDSPRTLIDHVSDVLLALSKKSFDCLCQWMNILLLGPQAKDFPSQRITRQQKELFVQTVLRERCNKRCLQEAVREFGLLCKGLSLNPSNGEVHITNLSRVC